MTPLGSMVAVGLAASSAAADSWRIDTSLRAAGSVELDDGAPRDRSAVVPSLAIRAERKLGHRVYVGGFLAAGMPAYFGQHELAVSADVEQVLREQPCVELDACDARISLTFGGDLGVAMVLYDAPPETPASSDALLYWGPLARV